MGSDISSRQAQAVNRGVVKVGVALMGVGLLFGAAGSAVIVAALTAGLRKHVKSSELPPSELALHHWRRAKLASRAGKDAWSLSVPQQTNRQRTAATPTAQSVSP